MMKFGNVRGPRKLGRAILADGPTHLSMLVIGARKSQDISQAKLAEMCQRSQPWVHSLESGAVWDISVTQISALSEALGLQIDQVMAACLKTYAELRSGLSIPSEESGQELVVASGELVVRPSALNKDPVAATLTRPQRANAAMGEFAQKRPEDPSTRWAGVGAVPIHLDDLPLADGFEETPDGGQS